MTLSQQAALAAILAEELETCGHDVIALDVLDALASTGMELIQPSDPATAEAYSAALRRGAIPPPGWQGGATYSPDDAG